MELLQRVEAFIREQNMIREGDRVCAGFSGGADSLFLLIVLKRLSGKIGFSLSACHVNHQLRGAEADADQRFAEQVCHEQGIPLFVYTWPVAEIAARDHLGLEEAGRMMRRKAYRDCMERYGANRIALAHHADDQAETVLFHLARGSALAGMAGIRPVSSIKSRPLLCESESHLEENTVEMAGDTVNLMQRSGSDEGREERDERADGTLIRPLLCVRKSEIEAWLEENGFRWRTDSSNLREDYTRNKIRLRLIPFMEQELNREAVRHIAETAAAASEADAYFLEKAAQCLPRLARAGEGWIFLSDALQKEEKILQKYVVMESFFRLAASRKDIGSGHAAQVLALFGGRTGSRVSLPYGMTAVREYDGVRIVRDAGRRAERERGAEEIAVRGSGQYHFGQYVLQCEILSGNPGRIPEKKYTKWLNYDNISRNLALRTRRPGDYMVINARGDRKKIKQYMIDEKIPQRQRDRIPLLAAGSEVYWVIGYRISWSARVQTETRQVLKLHIAGGISNGKTSC